MKVTHPRRLIASWQGAAGLLTLTGCQGHRTQSALHPAGPAAAAIAQLWWILLTVLGLYALAVFALTLIAIFRGGPEPPKDSTHHASHDAYRFPGRRLILGGGVILPAMILVPLLLYSLSTTTQLRIQESGLTIRVVGHRWWWEVEYPEYGIVTANQLTIPVGQPVRLELTSADVIHSFWVPQLHGKMDLIPGKQTTFWLQADQPGTYRGQCAEYCGLQHAHMAFEVIALPPAEFVAWLNQAKPAASSATLRSDSLSTETFSLQDLAPEVEDNPLRHGASLFLKHGCGVCHAVAGSPAQGEVGPDLTLLADRRMIAAARLPNTPENLLKWLANPQAIKPGVNMPPTEATPAELRAIVAYLLSLGRQGGADERSE